MIKVTINEPSVEALDRALKVFKKLTDKDGFIRELRDRRYYKKPSVKKREKSERARRNKK